MGGKGDGKKGSQERPRSRGRAKAKPQPAPKGRSSSAPGRPKSRAKSGGEDEKRVMNARPGRASSTNTRRPARPPPRESVQRSWEHPEGKPFKELREGMEMTGVVVNVSELHGVFIDIGYERNLILGAPKRYWRRFRRGDVVEGLLVHKVDVKEKRGVVTIDDFEASLSVSRRPIEEFRKDTYINGVVDRKEPAGVFVNIGAEGRHGRLQVPRFLGTQLQRGQILRDLYIGRVDLEQGRISLLLDDVEGSIEEMEMVSAHALLSDDGQSASEPRERSLPPETKNKAKPKAKAAEKKKPAEAKDPKQTKSRRTPEVVEQFEEDYEEDIDMGVEVGDLVDGVVVKISARSVLVDVDGPGRCNLQVPPELKDEFRRGDRVQGMKVEKISPAGVITLSMDDPELEVDYQPSKNGSHNGKGEFPKEKGKGKGNSKGNSRK